MVPSTKTFPRWIAITLATTLLALLAGGARFYSVQKQTVLNSAIEQLHAIGRLKADEIAAWLDDRRHDSEFITNTPFFNRVLVDFLNESGDAQELLPVLSSIQSHSQYSDILLVRPDGQIVLSLKGADLAMHSGYTEVLAEAFSGGKPVFTNLHAESADMAPHIGVVSPIFAGEGASAPVSGAIILLSDASQFLYPLIQSWPTPSQTAETLLVQRDGEEVVFLNELRHQPGSALKLRIPLSRTEVPAVMAVQGRQGVVNGIDYRGTEVVSTILAVPNSPWYMIAKQDAAEVFAEWHSRSTFILALLAALVLGLGAVGLVIWQRYRKVHFRSLYLAEATIRAGIERHSITLKGIGDGVIATDAQGRVELLNPVAEALTGWTQADALGRPLEEVFTIVSEITREKVVNPVAKVLRDGLVVGLANHTLLIGKDGIERPIADSAAPIHDYDGEISGVVLVFRDQSDERRMQQLTRVQIALQNYALTHTVEELITKTLDEIGLLVNSPIGFYHFVGADQKTLFLQQWSTRTLQEFCRAEGRGMHYSVDQAGVWTDCLHQGKPVIHNNYALLPHKKGLPAGHAELVRELVVPVIKSGKVVAILGVGNKPTDYTDKDVDTVNYLADVIWHLVEHRRSEAALHDSEKRYRRLFEAAKDGILILNFDTGRVVDINPYLLGLLGSPSAQLRGQAIWEIPLLAGIASSQEAFATLQGLEYIRYEIRKLQTDDGRHVHVEFSSNIYQVDNSKVIQCTIRDITERKRAEAERERLMAAIEQVSEVIVITDAEGFIQYVNPAFEAVTGYSRQEAPGHIPGILKSEGQDEESYRRMWSTISSGQVFKGRLLNKRKDGSPYTEETTISPVTDAAGTITNYVTVKRDITEQLRLEAQFQQAQKMESVGRLAGGIAHDFNNMLSVILGYTEMALEAVDPSEQLHSDLQEILNAANRSTEVTRRLLAFARKQTIAPQVLDLNETIEGMLKMLSRLIGEDIDLAWLPGKRMWPVRMDPSQIDQILANMCVNSRDAISGVGRITIETGTVSFDEAYCAEHPGFVAGDFVTLVFSDNGCGMDKATMSNLFEPFFTTKDVGKGTGLGLAMIYGIVKQNNGFINVYSEPGKGTTFKIYLARHAGATVAASRREPAFIPPAQGETVLIVEDEASILKLTRVMLEKLGYTVLVAATPGEAMQLAEAHAGGIHLLMTDVVMPEMNGRDLAQRLTGLYPDIKLLFMSGYTANVIAHHGVLDEGISFIQKPFSLKDIAIRVRQTLDRR